MLSNSRLSFLPEGQPAGGKDQRKSQTQRVRSRKLDTSEGWAL